MLAEQAACQLDLDKVLLVVAGDPWRKSGRVVASAEQRLEMTHLAVQGNQRLEASDLEVRREGPTYLVDTLRALSAPGRELVFILGEDAARDLPNWREPDEILRLATLAVAPRGEDRSPPDLPGGRMVRLDMPRLDVSSSDLRQRVRTGGSIRYLVPDAVAAYIQSHGLYGANEPSPRPE